jgi:hypothetical protein
LVVGVAASCATATPGGNTGDPVFNQILTCVLSVAEASGYETQFRPTATTESLDAAVIEATHVSRETVRVYVRETVDGEIEIETSIVPGLEGGSPNQSDAVGRRTADRITQRCRPSR